MTALAVAAVLTGAVGYVTVELARWHTDRNPSVSLLDDASCVEDQVLLTVAGLVESGDDLLATAVVDRYSIRCFAGWRAPLPEELGSLPRALRECARVSGHAAWDSLELRAEYGWLW